MASPATAVMNMPRTRSLPQTLTIYANAVFIAFVFSTPSLAFVMLGVLLTLIGLESWCPYTR
jgi:hypothetical protein